MGVNQSRGALNQTVTDAVKDAKLIGFNDQGKACVWSGGYTFNVYDAARDWQEIRAFTSGQMVEYADKVLAKSRMQTEGFRVIE